MSFLPSLLLFRQVESEKPFVFLSPLFFCFGRYPLGWRRGLGDERPPPSQRLNPLAIAKGQKLLCELTGKNASIVVNYFGVPYYYCDRTTLELDWNGIKHKIAQLLVPLRQPPSVIPSVEERERQESNVRKSKLALIDLCRMEATKFLVHGDFELSIPGAVQALRYSLDVYGAGKIQLVPCYLLLAEANLGLGRHKQAEEYLSLANWSILKNPDCSNRTKSQLYRNFGKLYASQVLIISNSIAPHSTS